MAGCDVRSSGRTQSNPWGAGDGIQIMNTIQTLGLLALLLSIVASLLCAARLRNWRHPILFVGLSAMLLMPGLVGIPHAESREHKEMPSSIPTVESVVQARYNLLRDEYERRAARAD